jgi:hypothetical protein
LVDPQTEGIDKLLTKDFWPAPASERHHPEQRACLAELAAETVLRRQVAGLVRKLERRIELALIPMQEAAREEGLRSFNRTGRLRSSYSNSLLEKRNGRRLGCHTEIDPQDFPQTLELANRRPPIAVLEG